MLSETRILIADDNLVTVSMLQGLLQKDYLLETAVTGRECLSKAAIFKPDIVLLDIILPDQGGYEVCQLLRAALYDRHPVVIMISAKTGAQDKLLAYKAGADDYVTKPFSNDELMAKIRVYSRLRKIVCQQECVAAQLMELTSGGEQLASMGMAFADSVLSEDESVNREGIRRTSKELLQLMRRVG